MATNPFGPSTSMSPFPSGGAPSGPHHPHGIGGFLENFGTDVKDAVVGLPAGTVHLVEHPVASIEQMAKSTWQTWSPLFHGHPLQFAHSFYEHPLAPLLDIATVFSGGLGAAGKLGRLTDAADESLLGRAAKLTENKTGTLHDLSGKDRHPVEFSYSTRPLRRLVQEHGKPRLYEGISKIPRVGEGVSKALQQSAYERRFLSETAHRVAATKFLRATAPVAAKAHAAAMAGNPVYDAASKAMMATTAMLAGKALSEPATAFRARAETAAGLWMNLYRHASVKDLTPQQAVEFLQKNHHYRPVKDPSLIDATHRRLLRSIMGKEARWEKLRAAHVEAAHSLPSIHAELEHHNALLKDMQDNGVHIVMPAKTKLKEPTDRQLMERNAAPIVEAQQNIKRLTKLREQAHVSKKIHDRATQELSDLKAQRLDLQNRSFAQYFQHVGSSEETFNSFAKNAGRYLVAGISKPTKGNIERAVAQAARDSQGRVRLVIKHDATMLGHELHNSSQFVKWLYRKPSSVWKTIQVGFTPRTVTNNGVGNFLIYAMRENPVTGAAGMLHALRIVHGDERTGEAIMHATPFKRNHWMFRHFGTELNNVFGHELLNAGGGRISAIKSGFYPLVHKVADEPIRMAAISAYLMRDPAVRALMKDKGLTFDQAAARALRKDPGLQARAAEHARTIGGDYQTLKPWERRVRDIAPFYLWDRHILKSTGNLVADTPGRAVLAQQVSKMGKDQTEKMLGALPEFLQGALPLSMIGLGKNSGDRTSVLMTQSLNPFATIGELAGLGQTITAGHTPQTGEALFSQVNPLLTGAIEYGTGTSLLTGSPKPRHGGLVTSIGSNLVQGFPEVRMAQGLLATPTTLTPKGKQKLYAVDHRSGVSSFLGVPVRNVSKSAANAMAAKEQGKKSGSGRKRKNPFA